MECLEETVRGQITLAWHIGVFHHMDPKKYPKRPDMIWDKDADRQSVQTMIAMAKAWASNTKEVLKKG